MEQEKPVVKRKNRSKGLRFLLWFLLILLLIIIAIPLLLQLKPVQTWVVDKATQNLFANTQTKTRVGSVDFSISKGLILEEVMISDPDAPQDTLAYIGSFSSSLKENLISLFSKELYVDELQLKDFDLRIKTPIGGTRTNIEELLNRMGAGSKSRQATSNIKPFNLNVSLISLENVSILSNDLNNGNRQSVVFDSGRIAIDTLDLEAKNISLQELVLTNPVIKLIKYQEVDRGLDSSDDRESDRESEATVSSTKDTTSFRFKIIHSEIAGGDFTLDNWLKAPRAKLEGFDPNHLHLSDFNIVAEDTYLSFPLELQSSISSMAFEEANGFAMKQLNVEALSLDEQSVKLKDFSLETNKSQIGRNLSFEFDGFSDFKKFAQEIEISADLSNTKLSFEELIYFFPELKRSPFVQKNQSKWIRLSGQVDGTVDDIDAEDISISFADLVTMQGDLTTSSLTKSESALVNLHVKNFKTSLSDLGKVIPDFNPPEQFYKLDPITFSGDIDGFFKDFVVYGTLDSPLGRVELDTRLNIKPGIDKAEYSGVMALENFDLKTWTDNPDLGFATFKAEIRDGRGLNSENLMTDLAASMEKFDYKGYTYTDVSLNGVFEQNRFNGRLISADPLARLDFDGDIFLKAGRLVSDFKANIDNIDLTALGLSEDISTIRGKIGLQLEGSKATDFVGEITADSLQLRYKNKLYAFDDCFVSSSPETNGQRNIQITTDFLNATIGGKFDFATLPAVLQNHLSAAHPQWSDRLGIKKKIVNTDVIQDFGYKVELKDSRDYFELLNIQELHILDLEMSGDINSENAIYSSNIKSQKVEYKNVVANRILLEINEKGKSSDHDFLVKQLRVGSRVFNPIKVIAEGEEDKFKIRVSSDEILDSLESLDFTIFTYPKGDEIIASMADVKIEMLSSTWTVNPGNKIVYGPDKINISGFNLDDGYRRIIVSDVNEQGIEVKFDKFDFLIINGIIDYDKIKFTGEGDLHVRKENLFKPSATVVKLDLPEFTLNDVDYGKLVVEVADDTSEIVTVDLKLDRAYDGLQLHLNDGFYNKSTKEIAGVIEARNLVMNTFEFIIPDGISNTGGVANLDAVISGNAVSKDNIKIDGVGQVGGGTTTIDYLGAELYFGTEKFRVTESVIDLTGGKLYDKQRNEADIVGRLNHKLFKDFTSELTMSSDRFLALDTEKYENPSYYGQGIGNISVEFSGPFSSTDILVDAVTSDSTIINIPVGDVYEDVDQSFIKVIDRTIILNPEADTTELNLAKLEGVDVRMNLTITQEAKVNIIFDESTNDIMKGVGEGNMRVVISRLGDFNIFGNYVIDQGQYLFTYLNGVISKPFTVKKGSEITWTGDPINANINLEANYENLKAPTNIFLAEYLGGRNNGPAPDEAAAKQRTDIDLKMYLTGTLYKPDVDFDIEFPELQGNLKTLAESKMRLLRTNDADMNEQVAGLIMFGSFLPSSSLGSTVGSASGLARTGYNTLSEMVSNQLSHILSGFLQEALSENGFVSGIDFELGFSKNSQFGEEFSDGQANNSFIPDEIEVHLKPRFKDDRWEVDYGTSYVNGQNNFINVIPNYVVHDFNIGFYLTDDRRLKLKAYGKWDKDVQGDDGAKYGIGLNFRKEFGSLTDFQKALTDDMAKLKKEKTTLE